MKVLVLAAVTAGCWAAAAGLAAAVDGPHHWLPSGVAALLCLLPAAGTLAAAGWTKRRTPAEALGFVLVAPVIRLVLAVGGGVILGSLLPDLKADPARFAFWGAGMYLVVLVAETALLLGGATANGADTANDPGAVPPTEPKGG